MQVVDAQGRVRASSADGDRLVALLEPAELAEVRDGAAKVLPGYRLGGAAPLRVVGLPAGPGADPQTVLVAVPLGQLQRSVRTLLLAVAAAAPLLLAVLAAVTWVVVGSALRPVDGLRRGAQEISGAGAARRLPVPAAEDEVRRLAADPQRHARPPRRCRGAAARIRRGRRPRTAQPASPPCARSSRSPSATPAPPTGGTSPATC